MSIIELDHVSKSFDLQNDRPRSFQELFVSRLRRNKRRREKMLRALEDVSFCVERGETLGIIGHNGSGKSTCLKLLTRILEPTQGTVKVQGRVSALLELGAGFHPELTGRENVFLYGSVLGLGRRDIAARFEEIVAFSEVERFIDVPIKFYSSGMQVRLAFATAIHVSPDVLLIDEVLAVGDQSFQTKCLAEIGAMRQRGVTIVFVSHSLDAVRGLCQRAIWLDHGHLVEDGPSEGVVQRYIESVYFQDPRMPHRPAAAQAQATHPPGPDVPPIIARNRGRWGNGLAQIERVRLLDDTGAEVTAFSARQGVTISVVYRAQRRLADMVCGIAIYRGDGLHVAGDTTALAGLTLPPIEGEGEVRCHLQLLPLTDEIYYASAALYSRDEAQTFDYHNMLYPFRIALAADELHAPGAIRLHGQWTHRSGSAKQDALEQEAP